MKGVKGFTLIEVLLVIAIIGMASSVTFQNLNSAREKARVAALRQFSAGIYHSIGGYLVNEMLFDRGVGTGGGRRVVDTSGYENDAGIWHDPMVFSDGITGLSGHFDANGTWGPQALILPMNAEELIITEEGTVEVWFNTTGDGDDNRLLFLVDHRDQNPGLVIVVAPNGDTQGRVIWDNTTNDGAGFQTSLYPIEQPINKWHHMAFTWKSDPDHYWFFIDGTLVEEGDFVANPSPDFFSYVGWSDEHRNAYDGYIDDVRIYSKCFMAI